MIVERYRYAFRLPLTLNGRRLTHRDGAWVHWTLGGQRVTTEVAPLPGFSRETLEEAIGQLEAGRPESPSARYAWEAARYQARHGLREGEVAMCGFAGSGAPVQKLKIAGPEDGARINATPGRLRLDANRRLTRDALLALCERIELDRVDYFEEPLARLDDYEGLDLPLAFDESLRETPLPAVVLRARAWVLKPMLLGLERTLELAGLAGRHGIAVVLSSSHESPLTIRFYHSLARDLGLTSPQGLDTLRLLQAAPC